MTPEEYKALDMRLDELSTTIKSRRKAIIKNLEEGYHTYDPYLIECMQERLKLKKKRKAERSLLFDGFFELVKKQPTAPKLKGMAYREAMDRRAAKKAQDEEIDKQIAEFWGYPL